MTSSVLPVTDPTGRVDDRGCVRLAELPDLRVLAWNHPVGSDAWWEALSEVGAPLRLPAGTGHDVLVVVHRDSGSAGVYVDLSGPTGRDEPRAGLLDRVPDTDVWAAAFRVPRDFVGSYAIVTLDEPPVAPGPPDSDETRLWWVDLMTRGVPDPWNPGAVFQAPWGGWRSVAVGSGAADTAVLRAAGATCCHVGPGADATALLVWDRPDRDRRHAVWVHVATAGAPSTVPLATLVLFDGGVWAEHLDLRAHLDEQVAVGALPPLVAVLVDGAGPQARREDLAANLPFLDAVADDLLPGVVDPYLWSVGLHRDEAAARTVVAGQSHGGLAAFLAGLHRPDVFGAVVAQSGAFGWLDGHAEPGSGVRELLADAPPDATRSLRTVLQYGVDEGVLTTANRALVECLAEREDWLRAQEVPGGHDWAWWAVRLLPAVRAVLA